MNVHPSPRTQSPRPITAPPGHAALVAELERRLTALVSGGDDGPGDLHPAMRHALLSGGKRLRPRLALAVACSCAASGEECELALRAACAVELVHTASLVHDDLPCFDDAATRRGRPTVHVRFGEPAAVLVGDALLTLAFEVLAAAPPSLSRPALELLRLLALAVGAREGIIGGQALESELDDPGDRRLERYHAGKTAALFRFAAQSGAVAARAVATDQWGEIGQLLGLAHQAADDLIDVCGRARDAGKPVGQDAVFGRPNLALRDGIGAASERCQTLLAQAERKVGAIAVEPHILCSLIDDLRRQLPAPAPTHLTHDSAMCQPVSGPALDGNRELSEALGGTPVAERALDATARHRCGDGFLHERTKEEP